MPLDAEARSLEELLIEQATVRFASLDGDQLTWSSATTNISGGGTIIPQIGQVVELYWNDVRKFRGHVTKTRVLTNRVQVTVDGPWWWLRNTPLTSLKKDATGTESERVSYVFPKQNVSASIKALILRAKALGCPIDIGTVSPMFVIPRVTLDQTDCATALATLLSWVPDCVAWVDYSGVLPKMHFQRRGPSTALNLSAADSNLETIDLEPRLDLKVGRVELKYMTRDEATGKPKFAGQSNGTNAAAKRQIITVSGPEIEDRLPADSSDSVEIQTIPAIFGATEVFRYDSALLEAATRGPFLGTFPAFQFPGWHVITSGEMADFLRKDYGLQTQTLRVSAKVRGTYYAANGIGLCGNYLIGNGLLGVDIGGSAEYNGFILTVNFTVEAINLSYPVKTTVYPKRDYDFLTPPAGLAENLKEAQNWLPWQGRIVRVFDEVSAASNILGRTINLTDSLDECATMKAPLKAINYEIQRGRVTYELGAPARNDYGSLVSRIRRAPKDNIEYIR